jgi:hypothetical protein
LLAKYNERAWEKYNSLTFDICKLCFELQVLTGNYEAAEIMCAQLFPHATSVQDKTDLYIIKFHRFELEVNMQRQGEDNRGLTPFSSSSSLTFLHYQHRLAEGTDLILQALSSLYGLNLPMDAQLQEQAFLGDIALIDKKLATFQKIQDLLALPECVDTVQCNIIKLYF